MKISAMMITRGRADYAREALDCFMGQTHEDKELVILDDLEEPSFPGGVDHPLVNYAMSRLRMIGMKRNQAASRCTGDVIAHWDSDDLYAPNRLEVQLEEMRLKEKAVSAFTSALFHEEQSGKWGRYNGHYVMAVGASLMYMRDWWKAHPFKDGKNNVGEDNKFAEEARGAHQIAFFDGGGLMVARAHPDNTAVKNLDHPNYQRVTQAEIPEWYVTRKQPA